MVSSRRKQKDAGLEEDTTTTALQQLPRPASARQEREQDHGRQQSVREPLVLSSTLLETRCAEKRSRRQEVTTSSIFVKEIREEPISQVSRSTSNSAKAAIPKVADLDQRMRSSFGLPKPSVVQTAAKSKLTTPKSILKQPKRTRDEAIADDPQPERSQIKYVTRRLRMSINGLYCIHDFRMYIGPQRLHVGLRSMKSCKPSRHHQFVNNRGHALVVNAKETHEQNY